MGGQLQFAKVILTLILTCTYLYVCFCMTYLGSVPEMLLPGPHWTAPLHWTASCSTGVPPPECPACSTGVTWALLHCVSSLGPRPVCTSFQDSKRIPAQSGSPSLVSTSTGVSTAPSILHRGDCSALGLWFTLDHF